MNESKLREIMDDLSIKIVHKNHRGWLVSKCPFAEFLHENGTDHNPSFFVKVENEGYSAFNCFSGDTELVTREGVKRFDVCKPLECILAPDGKWVQSDVKSYGRQRIWELRVTRNRVTRTIRTTEGHRWFTQKQVGRKISQKITSRLRKGDRLLGENRSGFQGSDLCADGVAHGIVYGDGSNNLEGKSVVCLFGEKMVLLDVLKKSTFFRRSSHVPDGKYAGMPEHVRVVLDANHLKELPVVSDFPDHYLAGFFAGYLATDGHVCEGVVQFTSSKVTDLLWIRDACCLLGISTFTIKSQMRKGYGLVETPSYNMGIVRSTLNETLFVRPDQRQLFAKRSNSYERVHWNVVSVEATDDFENVYCCEVPDYAAFTLAEGIVTGNCYSCHQRGNIRTLVMRLGHYREERYNRIATKVSMAETPDKFGDYEDLRAEIDSNKDAVPLEDSEVYLRMYPLAWEDKEARKYLAGRNITQEACELLDMRYDPEAERIIYPVYDNDRKLYGFTGRTILEPHLWHDQRYKKIKDYAGLRKEKLILGEQLIDANDLKPIIVVEGLIALAVLVSRGVTKYAHPVATMGAHLSETQRDILTSYSREVIMCYDMDAAGDAGLLGAMEPDGGRRDDGALALLGGEVPVTVALYPEGVDDVDEFTDKHVAEIFAEGGRIDAAEFISLAN